MSDREISQRTQDLITSCPCASGCPSCVGPEGNTGPHAKQVASLILLHLLSGEAMADMQERPF